MAVVSECEQAVKKPKETNVIYKNISDATKKTIEEVSNVNITLMEKSTKEDIVAFTVQRMN